MPRYKLTIEYDGTGFHGWQRMPQVITIQQVIEEALAQITQRDCDITAAGRTDAGVHALGQAAHVDMEESWNPFRLQQALNFYLNEVRVSIVKVEEVAPDFSARFSATMRHYRYRILNRRAQPALSRNYVWHVPHPLDADAMQRAAQCLLGTHDFSSFRASDCQAKSAVRTLSAIRVERLEDEIHLHLSARSFLYNQVRITAGSLTQVGLGKWKVEDFERAFKARDRTAAAVTAPPQGLTFMRVDY